MSVNFDGKINLLSGHYQDIIIRENEKGNYRITVTPSKLYHVKELDKSYCYPKYDRLTDLQKVEKVIDSYLYHNTIFMLTDRGRLKFHSGEYQAINAYPTFIDGYQSISRAMYLKSKDKGAAEILIHRISEKYQEDRIRHLDQILECKEIIIETSLTTTSYIIKDKTAYICLFSKLDKDFKTFLWPSEIHFFKTLLIEFSKENGYHINYRNEQTILYNDDNYREIAIPDDLTPYILQAKNEIDHRNINQGRYHNVTIDEYLSSLNQKPEKEKEFTLFYDKK